MVADEDRRKRWVLRIGLIVWLVVFTILILRPLSDNKLHLVFCDVGQGDAIIARYGNNQVLIDGGPAKSSGALLNCLKTQMSFWDREIEMVVNTHPDEDHFGGLVEVLRRYQVTTFLYNGDDNLPSDLFQKLKSEISVHKICTHLAGTGESLRVGEIYFDILNPEPNKEMLQKALQEGFRNEKKQCQKPVFVSNDGDRNENSIVLRLRFGGFEALLTGDIPAETEQILSWRKVFSPVEVLKIAHHGSKASTSDELLLSTKPQLAVISVGENKFGHPTAEVLEKLTCFGISYLRTDKEGTVEIISDGKKWRISK